MSRRSRRWPERIYAALLWLYPPSLRREYGPDMLQAFRDTLRDETRRRGRRGALRAWTLALGDLAASLPREWPRELRRGWRGVRQGRPRRRDITRRVRLPGGGWRVDGWISNALRDGAIRPAPIFGPEIEAEFTRRAARRATMNGNFEKFTERARTVLSLSQEEAQRFNHNYIGTEHLLLGLIREEEGIGAKALVNLGIELEKARNAVEFIIGRGDRIVLGEIGLTPRARKVIELSVDEARRLGQHYIGTEHLLLGIIREGEGIAAGVLESQGVNLDRARSSVLEMLGARGAAPSIEPPATEAVTGPAPVISVITLVCRDVAATQTFYVDYLGAVPLSPGPVPPEAAETSRQLLRLRPDGPVIGLRAADPAIAAMSPASAGSIELSFFVRDVGAFWSDLRQRGAPGLSEISVPSGSPQMRAFTLTDPDERTLRFQGMFRG